MNADFSDDADYLASPLIYFLSLMRQPCR